MNRPFRYAACFFILLATATLLFLFWEVPADTLANASGGIIGYELGQSLSQLLTIYGAALFLAVFWVVLFTLAFGVKWNKTCRIPCELHQHIYKIYFIKMYLRANLILIVPHLKSTKKQVIAVAPSKAADQTESDHSNSQASVEQPFIAGVAAERLFDDMVQKESQLNQPNEFDLDDDEEFEKTIAKAHQLEQDSQRTIATEVWRALNTHNDQLHKQDIEALLKAAEDETVGS